MLLFCCAKLYQKEVRGSGENLIPAEIAIRGTRAEVAKINIS